MQYDSISNCLAFLSLRNPIHFPGDLLTITSEIIKYYDISTRRPHGLTTQTPSCPSIMKSLLLLILLPFVYLVYRVVEWRRRIARFRLTMHVIPILVPPWSVWRMFWPRKWQTYHLDWQILGHRTFNNLGNNLIPLVSLFGNDIIFVSDADAITEVATNEIRFPKDLRLYGTHLYV
jgi:hypothetical protein